jgi:DNA uptake protein ComE-like DNA-binding protein
MPSSDSQPPATRDELRQLVAELGQHSSEMKAELTVELHELRRDLGHLGRGLHQEVRRSAERASEQAQADAKLAVARARAQADETSDHLRAIGSGLESRLILSIAIAATVSVITVIGAMTYLLT